LLPAKTAKDMGLRVGDQVNVSIFADDVSYERELVYVGSYNYFPSIYPEDLPTLVMNIETIFDNPEAVSGYSMWLALKPDAKIKVVTFQIQQMIGSTNVLVKIIGNAVDAIETGKQKPERMGLFGVLSVGFLMTGLMPGIGFVLYSYASLRRRFIQLGILQAIGLSVRQLIGYLVLEQFLLMGLAIGLGAMIGLFTSTLFVPFLQVGAAPGTPIPPFWVLIGWTEAAWLSLAFGVILFLTVLGTIFYLARLKVFQAVKLGETL
jgi:putative ABC transport system permease protein